MSMYHFSFTHSSTSRYLCSFHKLTIVNHAMINMRVQICLQDPDTNSFGYICRGRIAAMYSI